MFPDALTESSGSLLTWIIFTPILGALLMAVLKGKVARLAAISVCAISFLQSILLITGFDRANRGFQFVDTLSWIPSLGVNYSVGVDGLSLWFILLTTFLTLLVVIHSSSVTKSINGYLASMLLLETGMLGTFLALDGLTFYVFWELMLVPMYFLIGVWGGGRRIYAALKFVLYTAFGSLLMLVAILYLAYQCQVQLGELSFYLGDWEKLDFPFTREIWLFAAFALAFSIKVPVFPLHTWLPDAHVEAPTGGSVILAGVLLKMGLYGLIRFCIPIFPEATIAAAPLFAVLGVVGIIYGALVAWVQTDMKKLVAYSSVSHLGFCVLGFASMNLSGIQGSVLQMINHGISTSALFFLVGVLYERKHTREISAYGGLAKKLPIFAAVFLVFTLSSIGLPLTNGFVGEFLILLGAFSFNKIFGALAVTGVIFGAIYMLQLYREVVFGTFSEEKNGDLTDINFREGLVLAPLLLLVFVLGLYPKPVLDVMEPSSQASVDYLQAHMDSGQIAMFKSEGLRGAVE